MRRMRRMRERPLEQPEPATRPAYKVREIATLLSVDDSTVYRWIEKGALPAYRFEDSIRVAPEDFDAFKRNSVIKPPRTLSSVTAEQNSAVALPPTARRPAAGVLPPATGLAPRNALRRYASTNRST